VQDYQFEYMNEQGRPSYPQDARMLFPVFRPSSKGAIPTGYTQKHDTRQGLVKHDPA